MTDGPHPLEITISDDEIRAWLDHNAEARALLLRVVARLREAGDAPLALEVDEFFAVDPPVDPIL